MYSVYSDHTEQNQTKANDVSLLLKENTQHKVCTNVRNTDTFIDE